MMTPKMPRYDEQELRAGVIDRLIQAFEMKGITPEAVDAWLVQEFGQHLAEIGGLRGFAERVMYGEDKAYFEGFLKWRGGRSLTEEETEAIDQGFADRLAACLSHHGLTMQEAGQRFEEYTGRLLDNLDLRQVPSLKESLAASRYLADMLDVNPRWLGYGEEAYAPEWYVDQAAHQPPT